jgi:peptide/nickel transport system substrate-binding protein
MVQIARRDLLKGAAALGLAGTLPATGPALAQTTQKRELVVAQGGDISKFDPHFSTSSNDIRVSFNIFDNLIVRHPDGKLYPGLATEWKLTAPTTWTFKIRPGVKWHNGDPFTAADAKWSLERTWDPNVKTRVNTVFTTIDRIRRRTRRPSSSTPEAGPLWQRAWLSTAPDRRRSTSGRSAMTP